ncbi:lipid-binding SYLF domain-containing protein [Vibrio methylphosphonaticus]|uniref:lipid-binding SYLF domain-containing protein n=1 Tax=Vibrio methylphosphonaticus TaxID=2946866 RepID=UPI00202AB175|nr:lipid-binding SYLF domain-containing protein [Vibrio methylphosphonaticus]MCL9776881.1 lipid-binding SYLF domain-containing protein [Vibrio methylphosphonaticus]
MRYLSLLVSRALVLGLSLVSASALSASHVTTLDSQPLQHNTSSTHAPITPPQSEDAKRALQVIASAAEEIDKFDSTAHWKSVKRLTGVAQAVVIFPTGGQAGFLVGAQWGEGILLTRHKHQWSEPVFVEFTSFMFGLLAGAQKIGGIGVILSDDVVDNLIQQPIKIGGTADLTLGSGVSGKVIGGTSGISAMMVSENKGLYFGGSIDTFQIQLNQPLNQALYGDDVDTLQVLDRYDSDTGYAQTLRKRLEGIAYRAVYQ